MSRKNLIIAIAFTLLCLLFYFAPLFIARCEAAETIPNRQQNYISVPITQWTALKDNTKLLDANLTLLQDSLTEQEKRSNELMSLLAEARNELAKTQQALQTANVSLATVKQSLTIANEYTVKLRKQIQQERKAAAEEREKAYWKGWLNGFCCGVAGGVIALATK